MPRGFILVALLAVLVVACSSDEEAARVETREEADAGVAAARGEEAAEVTGETVETTVGGASGRRDCPPEATEEEIRIGDFSLPEDAPGYEVVEEEIVEREDVRAIRLLVDTTARSEADYTRISQDIKAGYADYDAVTAQFTDTTGTLSYNGSALIFNTPCGAYYMGFIYGPPNNEGYFVSATGDR